MVSVSYSDVHNVMNLTLKAISAANTENLIDYAIDMLDLHGDLSISNMTGTAGSKTVTLTQRERAAVLTVVRALYLSFYKNIDSANVAGVVITPQNVFDNPVVMRTIRECARLLKTRSFERT